MPTPLTQEELAAAIQNFQLPQDGYGDRIREGAGRALQNTIFPLNVIGGLIGAVDSPREREQRRLDDMIATFARNDQIDQTLDASRRRQRTAENDVLNDFEHGQAQGAAGAERAIKTARFVADNTLPVGSQRPATPNVLNPIVAGMPYAPVMQTAIQNALNVADNAEREAGSIINVNGGQREVPTADRLTQLKAQREAEAARLAWETAKTRHQQLVDWVQNNPTMTAAEKQERINHLNDSLLGIKRELSPHGTGPLPFIRYAMKEHGMSWEEANDAYTRLTGRSTVERISPADKARLDAINADLERESNLLKPDSARIDALTAKRDKLIADIERGSSTAGGRSRPLVSDIGGDLTLNAAPRQPAGDGTGPVSLNAGGETSGFAVPVPSNVIALTPAEMAEGRVWVPERVRKGDSALKALTDFYAGIAARRAGKTTGRKPAVASTISNTGLGSAGRAEPNPPLVLGSTISNR